MIRIKEIAFTAYPVTDVSRARSFYEGVLDLKPTINFEHEGKAWIEYDIGPATLAITNMSPEWKPSTQGPLIAFEVEDFDAAVETFRSKGVRFNLEPVTSPMCRYAVVGDPDGNSVSIHRRNSS